MNFSDFKSVEDVQKVYPIETRKEQFLPDVDFTPSNWFLDDLHFSLSKQANVESEMFFREHFIGEAGKTPTFQQGDERLKSCAC